MTEKNLGRETNWPWIVQNSAIRPRPETAWDEIGVEPTPHSEAVTAHQGVLELSLSVFISEIAIIVTAVAVAGRAPYR